MPNPSVHARRAMVGPDGLEPSTPRLSSACSNQLSYEPRVKWHVSVALDRSLGGADRIRTGDPLLAKQMLYQLSYDPRPGHYCDVIKNISKIYFVRSTETRTTCYSLSAITLVLRPSAIITEMNVAVSLERR